MDEVGEPGPAEGVAVISVWTRAAGGGMLARLTLTGPGETPDVRVVTSASEVRSVLDDWLKILVP